jgi:hypothetical protein
MANKPRQCFVVTDNAGRRMYALLHELSRARLFVVAHLGARS